MDTYKTARRHDAKDHTVSKNGLGKARVRATQQGPKQKVRHNRKAKEQAKAQGAAHVGYNHPMGPQDQANPAMKTQMQTRIPMEGG